MKAKHGIIVLDTGPVTIERIITKKEQKIAYFVKARDRKYAYPSDLMQIWLALRDEFKQQYHTYDEYRKAYQQEYHRRYFQTHKPEIMQRRKERRLKPL